METQTRTEKTTKIFTNRKLYDHDFRGQDLSHADFRGGTLVGCNFDSTDLSYATFEGANLYRSSFQQARMYRANLKDAVLAETVMDPRDFFGVTLTLTCDSFDRMKLGDRWRGLWLYLISMTDVPDEMKKELVRIIGERRFEAMEKALKERQI